MNSSTNQTLNTYECFDSHPGIEVALSSLIAELTLLSPLHIWTLSVAFSNAKQGKGIPPSDIFTLFLSVMEIISCFGFFLCVTSLFFKATETMYIAVFMLGKYIIGRLVMNCLICLERFVAVVYPVFFIKFSTLSVRCGCVALACFISWSFGAYAVFFYPGIPLKEYSIFLVVSLWCITAYSLGVLKALLKPPPGNKETAAARNKKKRAFWVITHILAQLICSYFLLLVVAMIKPIIAYDTYCLMGGFSMWLLRPSSAIQPVLYLSKYKKLSHVKKKNVQFS